ncbi:MAG: peptidoglycan DD-metalloendopeptidase family protein [Bacteroidales bacterium]
MVLSRKISFIVLFVLPTLCLGQVHEKGMMKNRANVEDESSSYTLGIFKDTTQYKQKFIEFASFEDNDDDAALDENDIVYETFDNQVVHYLKKFDYSSMEGRIPIRLINDKAKKFYTCPVEGLVTSHFGPRRHRFHYGTDIGMRLGTPIKAMFDGVVRYAKWCNGYGNLVVVRHDNGLETYYGHMSKITSKQNQKVKAGEVIGLVGSTGRSSGPHLHLEIRYLGAAINPEHMIDFSDFSLKDEKEMFYLTRNDFKPSYNGKSSDMKSSSSRLLAKSKTRSTRSGKNTSVTVRKGETLSQIAKRNGTTVKKLCKLNGIQENKIKAGQKLKVK